MRAAEAGWSSSSRPNDRMSPRQRIIRGEGGRATEPSPAASRGVGIDVPAPAPAAEQRRGQTAGKQQTKREEIKMLISKYM